MGGLEDILRGNKSNTLVVAQQIAKVQSHACIMRYTVTDRGDVNTHTHARTYIEWVR
jgi:hypothetical protein